MVANTGWRWDAVADANGLVLLGLAPVNTGKGEKVVGTYAVDVAPFDET